MKKILKLIINTEGQSLVEFALVLPFLLALILGMGEFGWILNGKITLTSAAREGARAAVVCENETKAQTAASTAVLNSTATSSLTEVKATVTTFDVINRNVVVTVTAKIKPIVGLFVGSDVIELKEVKAEMRIE